MNARTPRLALSALLVLTLTAAAWAQEQDAFVQRYALATEHLRLAVDAMPADGVSARESVDRAFASLLTLARDAAGNTLVTGMQRVFDRARTAIGNNSRDDLAVQAAVLRGGFQRLLYDAALRAAIDGDLPTARARLLRVADDVGFAPADRAALADPNQPTATLRFLMEVGVAEVVTTRLAVASELAPSDTGAAYRALADAYGTFLLVQDSPRTVATLNQRFVEAANALVAGDTGELLVALDDVDAQILAMGTAAQERRASVPGGGTALAPQPLVLPGVDPEEILAEDPDVAAELDEAAPGMVLVDLAQLLFELQETARREQLDALEAELAAAGMPAPLRPGHAERLLDAGFETLAASIASLTAGAARVVAAAHLGEDAAAHDELARVATGYAAWLSPIVRPREPLLDTDTIALLDQLADATPLRVQDAVVLVGQLDALAGTLAGEAVPALQRGAATTTTVWAGTLRDLLTLVLGLLALVPLFLLNLAFGGGNRHWQAIGVALFLLWLPALFEGVIGLGGVLATYAGFDALLPLAAFSVFGSAPAQTVWAALMLLAVLFAISGLTGISRQFGLLGGSRRKPTAARGEARTAGAGRRTESTAKTVDWDDEA